MKNTLTLALAVAFAGCSEKVVPVQVVTDSYCQASRKVTWHTDDTAGTIEQIEAHNRSIDRACNRKRVASK